MFDLEGAETVFPTIAGEERAVVERGLSVQIELGGPPCRGAVLELDPVGMEIIAPALRPEGREIFYLKVSGLFEMVIVRDDIRTLLGESPEDRRENEHGKTKKARENSTRAQDKTCDVFPSALDLFNGTS